MLICLSWYLHNKQVLWNFNTYGLTFGDKTVRELYHNIWNQLLETLNGLSEYLKDSKLIGLDLSATEKVALTWITNPMILCIVSLISDLILVFYRRLFTFRITSFTIYLLKFFYPRIIKPYINRNIIEISSFKLYLILSFLDQLISFLRANLWYIVM